MMTTPTSCCRASGKTFRAEALAALNPHVEVGTVPCRLVADNGLPPPDEVRHRPGEVVLLYHEKKLAFVFELSAPWPEDRHCDAANGQGDE